MNAVGEFLKAVLSRPTGWIALVMASGAYLLLEQQGHIPASISVKYKEFLSMGALGIFLVSAATLTVQVLGRLGGLVHKQARDLHARQRLHSKIRRMPSSSRALVGVLAMRNESTIWLMNDFRPALDARRANIVRLNEAYGQACRYEFDFNLQFELQKNMALLDDLAIQQADVDAVVESERRARGLLANRWMGA